VSHFCFFIPSFLTIRSRTESDKFMMVYASNAPHQFDSAVLDRVDQMIPFDLPQSEERRRMITYYIDKYLLQPPSNRQTKVTTEGIGEEEIERVVRDSEGFSGRAIGKLAVAWQAAAYGTEGALLDKDTFFEVFDAQKQNAGVKQKWARDENEEWKRRADLLVTDA